MSRGVEELVKFTCIPIHFPGEDHLAHVRGSHGSEGDPGQFFCFRRRARPRLLSEHLEDCETRTLIQESQLKYTLVRMPVPSLIRKHVAAAQAYISSTTYPYCYTYIAAQPLTHQFEICRLLACKFVRVRPRAVGRKESAVHRLISRNHPHCDLDHTRVAPHEQRAHLASRIRLSCVGECTGKPFLPLNCPYFYTSTVRSVPAALCIHSLDQLPIFCVVVFFILRIKKKKTTK